jgi:uncharacterized membrane protein
MTGAGAVFLGLIVVAFFIGGPVCGIIALVKMRKLDDKIGDLEGQLGSLQNALKKKGQPIPLPEKEIGAEKPPEPVEVDATLEVSPGKPASFIPPKAPSQLEEERKVPPPLPKQRDSLEMKLGTKWLNWVGIVMLLVGVGFFLKYAYDNAWIGPKGRLAIGTLFGIASIGIGERFRRRHWDILFQVLTGGGLAAFYLCVFFSFQVYHLSDQTLSMVLAVLVTALAVVMAVAHDAISIAILALIGGFLSPVLLSTGTNHPYVLFSYIAILDLVAMGAAYFRKWRALDLLCFIGTAFIYVGWHSKFYAPDQMLPALIYISLFYLMFLLIPILHSLVRHLAESSEGLAIIVLNAVFSFFCYYSILFRDYRYALGFVVLGQALLVFLLFQTWSKREVKDSNTCASLLIITLGLVTIAIPIQLKMYGVPIAWGMEGAVLVFLGIRFRQTICKVVGMAALVLAAGGLVSRLPLHKVFFIPIFNVPFGSWTLVIAMAAVSVYLLKRDRNAMERWRDIFIVASSLLAFSMACYLLSVEVSQFWTINYRIPRYRTYEMSSLVVLWSLIPAITAYVLYRKGAPAWMALSWICFGIGTLVLFVGLAHYRLPSGWLILNGTFAPKLMFVVSLWWCGKLCRQSELKRAGNILEMAGHGVLALLVAFEFARWGQYSHFITAKMGISLISAAWALHALIVIWIGLATRNRLLRYLGFVLFVLTIGKTLLIDMSEMEKVYRIVSFAASGLLLVTAGYFYQRYSSILLERPEMEKEE